MRKVIHLTAIVTMLCAATAATAQTGVRDLARLPRVEATIRIPKLVYEPGERFSILLQLHNPSKVPVEVPEECLEGQAFRLQLMGDPSMLNAKRLRAREGLSLAPGGTHDAHIEWRKLYGKLKKTGRYWLSWSCGDWKTPVYDLVFAEPYSGGENLHAVITTDLGEMEMSFLTAQAPVHVRNFIQLARAGYFDGVLFHKVIPGYHAETGDPRGDGTGGWDRRMAPEIDDTIFPGKGLVGATRKESSLTNASQFFILLDVVPTSKGKHTFFGYIRSGEEVLDRLNATEVGATEGLSAFRPRTPIRIRKIEIREN